jgi:hypothetical protein
MLDVLGSRTIDFAIPVVVAKTVDCPSALAILTIAPAAVAKTYVASAASSVVAAGVPGIGTTGAAPHAGAFPSTEAIGLSPPICCVRNTTPSWIVQPLIVPLALICFLSAVPPAFSCRNRRRKAYWTPSSLAVK